MGIARSASSSPEKAIIGAKEISRGIKSGTVKKVVVAKNCPKKLLSKLSDVKLETFNGDQVQLGTKLGKPFPVAMVGFKNIYSEFK